MKARDLMMGDYISIKPSGMPIKIAAVHHKKIAYHATINKLTWIRESLLEPIPLTPEIFEKNGFTCDENIAKLVERDDTNNILWSAKYSFFTGMIEVVNKITDEKVKVRCYSVHELQHIFRLLEIEKEIII